MNRTELVFILDMSGSMAHLTDDTVGGFNSILKEQSGKEGEVLVTTYLFNNDSRMIHDRMPIREVPPMTEKDYRAGGCTALLDAVGGAIRHIVGIHRYARKEDIPDHTVFVITTDGMENASHRYSADRVKEMIRHETEKYGGSFYSSRRILTPWRRPDPSASMPTMPWIMCRTPWARRCAMRP